MVFETEEDKILFVKGVPYFKSLDNYCLGSTLDDAGDIAQKINQARLKKEMQEQEKKNEEGN